MDRMCRSGTRADQLTKGLESCEVGQSPIVASVSRDFDVLDPWQIPFRLQVVASFGIVEFVVTGLCQWSGRNEPPMDSGIERLPGSCTGPVGIAGKSATSMLCTVFSAWKSE
jgi:hypothetical protein